MKIIIVSILIPIMLFGMAKVLFVSDAKELNLILKVRFLIIDLMFAEKITFAQGR